MVHVLATGWPHFRHLHPFIFGKACGHDFVGIFHVSLWGNRNRLWHFDNRIRRRDIPAFCPVGRWRRIARITGASAGIGPCCQRGDLLWCQRRIVRKASATGVGKPRRHSFRTGRIANPGGPLPRFRVGYKRERRRNLARAMATLTVLLQDRQHLAIESRTRGRVLGWMFRIYKASNPPARDGQDRQLEKAKPHDFLY